MERITTKEAAEILNINVLGIQELLKQEKLPIGYAIKMGNSTRYTYIIYRELVQAFKERVEKEGRLF